MESTRPPSKRLRKTPARFVAQQEPMVETVELEPVPSTSREPELRKNRSKERANATAGRTAPSMVQDFPEVPLENVIPVQETDNMQIMSDNTNQNMAEDLRELKATVSSLADIVHTLLPGQIHQGNRTHNEEQGSRIPARPRSTTSHMSYNNQTEEQVPQEYGAQTLQNGQLLAQATTARQTAPSYGGQANMANTQLLDNRMPQFPSVTAPLTGEYTTAPSGLSLMYTDEPHPGLHLSQKLRENIAAGKYVDFYDILYPDYEQGYSVTINSQGQGPILSFTPRKRRQLSETEWCSAWDDYMAVYVHHHPVEVNELISYGKRIKSFMTNKQNWRFYDERFRRERESRPFSWASIRFDIQLQAAQQPFSNQPLGVGNLPFRAQQGAGMQDIPKGHCFRYHNSFTRCENNQCKFRHTCPICQQNHPVFKCTGKQQNVPKSGQNEGDKKAPDSNKSQNTSQAT